MAYNSAPSSPLGILTQPSNGSNKTDYSDVYKNSQNSNLQTTQPITPYQNNYNATNPGLTYNSQPYNPNSYPSNLINTGGTQAPSSPIDQSSQYVDPNSQFNNLKKYLNNTQKF